MFKIVMDVKQMNSAPYSHDLIGAQRMNVLDAVSLAESRAKEHAADIAVDPPYRHGDGFQFRSSNGSLITYRAEEI